MGYQLDNQEDLIIKYLPLVKNVVSRIESRNHNFEKEDLINIGVIGLIDAIEKYDYRREVPFEAYARFRIRGEIIDELRKAGPVSRDRMDKLNEYYRAKEKLENKFKRSVDESEIIRELGIDRSQLSRIHETVHYISGISLESLILSDEDKETELIDLIEDGESLSPEENITEEEKSQKLIKAIDQLEEREQLLLNLYYVEELSMKEIAYILDISIPRVSQIHGKTLLKLRDLLGPYMEGD